MRLPSVPNHLFDNFEKHALTPRFCWSKIARTLTRDFANQLAIGTNSAQHSGYDVRGIGDHVVRDFHALISPVLLGIENRRATEPGEHRGYPDTVIADIRGQRFAKTAQAELGGAVRGQAGGTDPAGYRRDVDDVPAAGRDHMREKQAAKPHRRQQIDLDQPVVAPSGTRSGRP